MTDYTTTPEWATHEARIERALARVAPFVDKQDDGDAETLLVDMLTDLMHWADNQGVEFRHELDMAYIHHEAEVAGGDI